MKTLHARAGHATLWCAVAASTLLSGCVVGPADYGYYGGRLDITVAPPPDRIVVAPRPRGGYIWTPGYYRWNGRAHVWTEGRYLRERRGYHWAPARWVERNGRYHFEDGHWER